MLYFTIYVYCTKQARRKGGGKGHVTPPRALQGGVGGGKMGGVNGFRGG